MIKIPKEKITSILDKVIFFGMKPPKPINWEEVRAEILNAYEEEKHLIKQAKKDAARKIFEEIEERYAMYNPIYNSVGSRIDDELVGIDITEIEWQVFKDKWLKNENI